MDVRVVWERCQEKERMRLSPYSLWQDASIRKLRSHQLQQLVPTNNINYQLSKAEKDFLQLRFAGRLNCFHHGSKMKIDPDDCSFFLLISIVSHREDPQLPHLLICHRKYPDYSIPIQALEGPNHIWEFTGLCPGQFSRSTPHQ